VLPASDAVLARRLLNGAFGFDTGGLGAEEAWLSRPAGQELPLGRTKLAPPEALKFAREVAQILANFEAEHVFPGPLLPRDLRCQREPELRVWITDIAWLRARLGAEETGGGTAGSAGSLRWTPPEQSAGAPWDNAANRYVLGLLLFRMLSGSMPFEGAGARHREEARATMAPALPEGLMLPHGCARLVGSLLEPKASDRPRSAADIVQAIDAVLGAGPDQTAEAPAVEAPRPPQLAARSPQPAPKSPPRVHPAGSARPGAPRRPAFRWRWSFTALLFAVASVASVLALANHRETSGAASAQAARLEVRPLTRVSASACAQCHAREFAEWRDSVMAHAAKSPLFGALESVVEEQVGRSDQCPSGAGALRRAGADRCSDPKTQISVTGSGGEHWCVNCHAGTSNLSAPIPAWSANGDQRSRAPLRELLDETAMEGISCGLCHSAVGPAHPGGAYQGNARWTSFVTGQSFSMRPEDQQGVFGISNSGAELSTRALLGGVGAGGAPHPAPKANAYLKTSEFCGACHDVRLFGTDAVRGPAAGESFKRLRNAYSEWQRWSAQSGSRSSCQDCHMSLFPGVCVPDPARPAGNNGCPKGYGFEARAPGSYAQVGRKTVTSHYFTSVDLPMSPDARRGSFADTTIDAFGQPMGLSARRDQLLRSAVSFSFDAERKGDELHIPVSIANVGAGHRVPAGFSQEREIWVELEVRDAQGDLVYQVGHVSRADEDLHDKSFLRVNTDDSVRDAAGRPLGMFGADIADGADVPRWTPNPRLGGTAFRGQGLINFQNGFLRCVRCIGFIDAQGRCQPGPGQGLTRADRYDDGVYDLDTGACQSNLTGDEALFETYFPIGGLDAGRGVAKAPDAIIDTRSLPPGVPVRYTYVVGTRGRRGPFGVRAALHFRAFPPFLIRAFADYEARMVRSGQRRGGAIITQDALSRLDIVDLATQQMTVR
jgi:eukaryotic-like serine/threonine-protein kinase